jgi:hypothetical protein
MNVNERVKMEYGLWVSKLESTLTQTLSLNRERGF